LDFIFKLKKVCLVMQARLLSYDNKKNHIELQSKKLISLILSFLMVNWHLTWQVWKICLFEFFFSLKVSKGHVDENLEC
jgi:hypothetical protein